MRNIKYIQIHKDNDVQFKQLLSMWIPYQKELGYIESDSEIIEDARQRVSIQGKREDMHFEICFEKSNMVGFCFYAIDRGGLKDILVSNLGYIMEFYILPQYRRQGYGSDMFKHVEQTFSGHGIDSMYLTSNTVNGKSFWCSLGFVKSGKLDPDNHMPIYIKPRGYLQNIIITK